MDKRKDRQQPGGSAFKKPGPQPGDRQNAGTSPPKSPVRPPNGTPPPKLSPGVRSSGGISPAGSAHSGSQFKRPVGRDEDAPGASAAGPPPVSPHNVVEPGASIPGSAATPRAQQADSEVMRARGGWDRAWTQDSWEDEAASSAVSWTEDEAWDSSEEESRFRDAWGERPSDDIYASVPIRVVDRPRRDVDPFEESWNGASGIDPVSRQRRRYRNDEDDDSDRGWGWQSFGYTMQSFALHAADGSKEVYNKSKFAFAAVLRWMRAGFNREMRPAQRMINTVLLICILGSMILSGAGMGLAAYGDYKHLDYLAKDGITALGTMFTDLGISKSANGKRASTAQVQLAQADLNRATLDFQIVHNELTHPDPIITLAGKIHSLRSKLDSALVLSSVADQAMQLLQTLFPTLTVVANIVATSPLSIGATPTTTTQTGPPQAPLLTTTDISTIQQNLTAAMPQIDQLLATFEATPLSTLTGALSTSQAEKLNKYIVFIPYLKPILSVLQALLPAAPTLLGVTNPANYLLMTLDSAEIRPVGGFQGQFSIISVNGGRVSPITLRDDYQIEPGATSASQWGSPQYGYVAQDPPDNYFSTYSWFGSTGLGWAMRNSGLSPDFAQSAQLALRQIESESKSFGGKLPTKLDTYGHVQQLEPAPTSYEGVIMIQVSVIAQVLNITGPITIGAPYNVQVTSDNVAQKIHYYQETNAGRKIGTTVSGSSSATKRFTELLSKALEDKVRTMDKSKLIDFISLFGNDLRTKDIQMYFADQTAEGVLAQYLDSSLIYQGTADDSLIVNDANISGNKIDQYLTEVITDHVTLDRYGNATHKLIIEYQFNIPPIKGDPNQPDNCGGGILNEQSVAGQVYDTIYNAQCDQYARDYRRIYVNPRATLIGSYSGFHTNASDASVFTPSYPNMLPPYLSDVPNHEIISGYYIYMWVPQPDGTVQWQVPDGDQTVQVEWIVSQAYKPGGTYTLHVQRQSGMNLQLHLTITPPSCVSGGQPTHFDGDFTTDQIFVLNVPKCK